MEMKAWSLDLQNESSVILKEKQTIFLTVSTKLTFLTVQFRANLEKSFEN